MVKFSKQFEGQLVPEWKEAFVDYWQLKKDLKKMQKLDGSHPPSKKPTHPPFDKTTLISPLRKLAHWFGYGHEHKGHGVIQVHKKLASSDSKGDLYETELLEQFADTDAAKEFFARLDQQLNKVNQFYKTKEGEFLERGESLKKQMEILVELKTTTLKQQRIKGRSAANESKEDPSITCSITCEEESVKCPAEEEELQECPSCDLEKAELQFTESPKCEDPEKLARPKREEVKLRSLSGRVFSCQGKNLKMSIPLTTPSRTLSALTSLLWDDLVNQSKKDYPKGSRLSINKAKVHRAEKMIRGAFVELYKGLGYLSTYRY